MKTYTVAQVAEQLSVYPDTVRRWIRNGDLKADKPKSRKSGIIITEDNLRLFLDEHKKYIRNAFAHDSSGRIVSAVPVTAYERVRVQPKEKADSIETVPEPALSKLISLISATAKVLISRNSSGDGADNAESASDPIIQLKEHISSQKRELKTLQEKVEVMKKEISDEEFLLDLLMSQGENVNFFQTGKEK